MAQQSELMAVGVPAEVARKVGNDYNGALAAGTNELLAHLHGGTGR